MSYVVAGTHSKRNGISVEAAEILLSLASQTQLHEAMRSSKHEVIF